jgi:hypothetical protein
VKGPVVIVSAHPCSGEQAYDQHLNMILGEVEEQVTTVDIDEETYEEIIKVLAHVCGTLCDAWKLKTQYLN